ncbi:aspartate aminotransferase family protein [Paenibacillus flagellatus]|uniref:Acetylornithine aminotransferase n=1 Tax=Paenibacillus flagellatus TaxID=2211139 RepID=A0A2V5K9Q4_9BACL|nr:aspartate aminotransferase family protein [Paenibacillus flagellatus]PYI55612.1 aspartate aminotransferase family protein [Paenibacillus flagellatus]
MKLEEEYGSSLFPTYAKYPIALVRGEGSRLWDEDGKEYLDFMSGLAVCNLGHAPGNVAARVAEQLGRLWHVSNLFRIPDQEKLAKLLTDHSCTDLVFFCNSGAEANEAAIKCARRYHQRVLGNGRFEIVTFEKSFHGRTIATLTATGQDKVKDGFYPLPEGFAYAKYNDLDDVEEKMTDRTAAVMLELVQGESGVRPADREFAVRLAELCERRGVLLIVDEVQTGMGRTGKLFAYEHYGIEPDIVTLAKGLAGGFPIGAMMGKSKLRDAFSAGSHASTFGGAPLAAAAGLATVETLLGERLPERAERMGAYALRELRKRLAACPAVRDVRGLGLLIGIECAGPAAPVIGKLHDRGLLVVPAGQDVIRFMPSLYVTEEEIDRAVGLVAGALSDG